ncbi:Domain of uncharacterised function (DUF2825) [Salmonella enterica subsp. arizonae]|nr:Domain of uncharacterised function (DUF2825) [Salmonella enterica subsp. arizonae]
MGQIYGMYVGLSPLARGTPVAHTCETRLLRFIPAGAGNTPENATGPSLIAVYPRWRGEHIVATDIGKVFNGLSPLARGTQHHFLFIFLVIRFIPAGAGNTRATPGQSGVRAVYPRWRGEHSPKRKPGYRIAGLSPLARGTHTCAPATLPARRFIPAGAGNTQTQPTCQVELSVYPRWRGEHAWVCSGLNFNIGLSPLARGTRGAVPPRAGRKRFIPAGAGNTKDRQLRRRIPPVYPRWRGEHDRADRSK